MNAVQVFVRQVYGKPLVYPANEAARRFAALLEVRSFTHRQLQGIEALGFTIEQVADPDSSAIGWRQRDPADAYGTGHR